MAIELYMENFSSRETLSLSPLFRSIHVILIFENNKKKKNKIKVFLEPSERHKFSSYPRKNITYILFTETVREVVDNHRLRTAISLQNCTCTTTWLSSTLIIPVSRGIDWSEAMKGGERASFWESRRSTVCLWIGL